ncbi:alpha/beta hydrolase [Phenylobacterium sp. Root700]|uniref:alpha/beta hydrolase n=1 Tax=Phenylobacterium sp. Root700 TaxID=1736591 RepID=UPI0006F1FAD4|nr:alpha/beta hydrolase [Phenylobacterium sp. Root700]KRB52866.1 hypothetical protein ASE02_00135 [Phenylobacterium sp. Root700]
MKPIIGMIAGLAALLSGGGAVAQSCDGVQPQPLSVEGAQTFTYAQASGRPLKIHVFRPAGPAAQPAPAILFFFGGGWRQGSVIQFVDQVRALQAKGYVAALADYRVFCRDGTTPVAAVDDAGQAYAWLRAHGADLNIDPRRVVLAGGSAGGHLALMTALRADPKAVPAALVLFNPAIDLTGPLTRGVNGMKPDDGPGISPALLDLAPLPPMIILHGSNDQLVPIETIRTFCARATTAGKDCRLEEYAGQPHGFFNRRTPDPALGTSPYASTLAQVSDFLKQRGISPAP